MNAAKQNSKPPGRPNKYDWDALYKEFLTAGVSKGVFLKSKGIARTAPQARGWTAHIAKTREAIKALIADRERDVPAQLADLFGLVKTMSMGLAVKHYKPAEFAIMHIELQLEKAFKLHSDGAIIGSHLTPRDLRSLLAALADAQKIQRLALGLSTDNIASRGGPENPHAGDEGHVEKPVEPVSDSRGPVFVVEVNANGKFLRPRPRLQLNVPTTAMVPEKKDEPA